MEPTPAPSHTESRSIAVESWAIWSAIICGVLGLILGYLFFRGEYTPLSGTWSIGTVGAGFVGVCTAITSTTSLLLVTAAPQAPLRWMRQRHWLLWILDLFGLVTLHVAIAVVTELSAFRLFQQAFQGLTMDHIIASFLIAIISAVSAYFGFTSAARASTRSLSTLLAMFVVAGVLASMLLAENPYWWHAYFSELGTRQAGVLSFWSFNTTLVIAGLLLVTLSNFITQQLSAWSERRRRSGKRCAHVWMLRYGLIAVGICLAGIAMVPISVNDTVHNIVVRVMAVAFCLMLFAMPLWLPGVPAALYAMNYAMLLTAVGATYLWKPLGYYNTTALELTFAGIVFVWLVVLIRTVDAMASEQAEDTVDQTAGTDEQPATAHEEPAVLDGDNREKTHA